MSTIDEEDVDASGESGYSLNRSIGHHFSCVFILDHLILILAITFSFGCASPSALKHTVRKPPSDGAEQQETSTSRLAKAAANLIPNRSPETGKTYAELAEKYHRQNRPEVAVRLYREAIKANPKDARLHYLYAHALGMIGDRENSIHHAKIAVRLEPHYTEAQSLLGIMLRREGRNAEAIEALQTAWQLSPPSIPAGLELAAWELNHHRPEEALRILEVCRVHQPSDSRVQLLLAEAYERAGKLADAEKVWRSLADRGVGGAEALEHLSEINEELGNPSLAKSYREEARRIRPLDFASQPKRRMVRARPYSDSTREFPPLTTSDAAKEDRRAVEISP